MDARSPGTPPRPTAVTVAAWLIIVPASVGSVLGAIGAFTSTEPLATGEVEIPPEVAQIARIIAGMITLAIGALLVLLAANLLRLRSWARTTTLVIQALWLLTWVALLAGSGSVHPIQHVVRGALPIAILVLLLTPRAVEAFIRTRDAQGGPTG